jgi:calcineurin-like phosphoesterase family protein
MDDFMIHEWNKQVGPDDLVYHLGDFALAPKTRKKDIMHELNGYKIAIVGNHDPGPNHMLEIGFNDVYRWLLMDFKQPGWPDKKILMIHEANGYLDNPAWDYILCGHVHSKWLTKGKAINVGVDQWVFKPISLDTAMTTLGVNISKTWTLDISREPKNTGGSAFLELQLPLGVTSL